MGTDSIYNNMNKNLGFYHGFYDYSRGQKLGSKDTATFMLTMHVGISDIV